MGGAKILRVDDEQGLNSFKSSFEMIMAVLAIKGCIALNDSCYIKLFEVTLFDFYYVYFL